MKHSKLMSYLGASFSFLLIVMYQNCAPIHKPLQVSQELHSSSSPDFSLPSELQAKITSDCMGCHPEMSKDQKTVSGEILYQVGWIIPQDPDSSKMIEYMETTSGSKQMPPGSNWAQTDINDLRNWIAELNRNENDDDNDNDDNEIPWEFLDEKKS